MTILAIDPGPTESAWLIWYDGEIIEFKKEDNGTVLARLKFPSLEWDFTPDFCAIEMIGHYGRGMPAGKEIFDTCFWIGRFLERFGEERTHLILRPTVKAHICGSTKAKDANIRQALIDRFGGRSCIRKGGPLYKIAGDAWQALALAITWWEGGQRLKRF